MFLFGYVQCGQCKEEACLFWDFEIKGRWGVCKAGGVPTEDFQRSY